MQKEIQERLVAAMKAGDKKYVSVLRSIKCALTEAEKLKKKDLTEQDCMDTLQSMAKKRNQSIEACGDNEKYKELKEVEIFELSVIEEYLPTKMTSQEIKEAISEIISIGKVPQGLENMGTVMKAFNEQYSGQNGKLVSSIVRETLTI